jgi:hypothetical protein
MISGLELLRNRKYFKTLDFLLELTSIKESILLFQDNNVTENVQVSFKNRICFHLF